MVHVIKVFLEESGAVTQIRRLALGSDIVSSYPLLKERIKDLLQLESTDLELKWKDSENDLILMSSDGELAQAIANAEDGLLKLYASEKKSESKKDKPNMKGEEHPLVFCDGCEQNIFGARYKCLQCKNFDLCSFCNYNNKHPHHDMIKLAHNAHVPREWAYLGSRRLWRSMFGGCPSSFFQNIGASRGATSSSSEDSQNESSDTGKIDNAFTQFLNGDFVNAQKLFSEGLGSFLKNWPGGVDIKLEGAPTCHHYEQRKRCSKKDIGKKEKAASSSAKQNEKVAEQDEKVAKKDEKIAKEEKVAKQDKTAAIQEEKVVVQPNCEETLPKTEVPQPGGIFADCKKNIPEVNNVVSTTVENEIKSSDTGEREKSPISDTESASCAEGWTFLQEEEANKSEADRTGANKPSTSGARAELEKMVNYPKLEKENSTAEQNSAYQDCGNLIRTKDPLIINALIKMQAMGFTNEGGWLERLLITKKGNINEALDALYPFAQRH
ncbi:sequestosome-1 [Trichonephila clavata]|uniref:Sequestosome-1 n=1 Tax=Trichonephila clavata TaxID=2740835 RepID=A0A8X6FRQ7_TRICU|nr:sequestosome-1 [Trichonephila clavata]